MTLPSSVISDLEPDAPFSDRFEFTYDTVWAAIAVLSLLAMGLLAPSGLLLLGFLGVIILVHELGHFVVARRFGMRPTEFFWGFGPEILALQVGDLRIGLKALFIGGYVKIPGMTPSEIVPVSFDESKTYRSASHTGRLLTILAGPFVNLAMAFASFAAVAMAAGNSFASSLRIGAEFVWIVVASTGEALATWVTSIGGYLGATFDGTQPPVRFLSPISQAEITSDAVSQGTSSALLWFGILSCAIGGVNLLPLPPLDGSHALVTVIEWVGQKLSRSGDMRFDIKRLEPLAYVTIFAIAILSISALVMDLRGVPLNP